MQAPRKLVGVVAAVAAIQSAALGWMIYDRISLIKNGREVILPIIPVDPRSLFRGDYVQLRYPVSEVSTDLVQGPEPTRNAGFYVTLQPDAEQGWKPERVTIAHPGKVEGDRIVLAARANYGWPALAEGETRATPRKVWVNYGIERYYVPEGKGLELEKMVGQKKLAAAVAVDSGGRAAIKGLAVDGKLVYDEPLF